MAEAYIKIEGLEEIIATYQGFGNAWQAHAPDAMGDIALYVVGKLQVEPAQAPGVKYRRTGAVAEGWNDALESFEGSDLNFLWGLENPVEHSGFVEDRETLLDLVGRWGKGFNVWQGHTVQDILEQPSTEAYIGYRLEQLEGDLLNG